MSKCLIIIDVQYGFINKNIKRHYIPKLIKLIKFNNYDYVVASRFINTVDSPYHILLHWDKMINEEETAIYKEIMPYLNGVFIKNGNSALTYEMFEFLKTQSVDEIFIAGLNTECCVLATANALFETNMNVKVLAKYCITSGGYKYHRAGLKVMKRMIGKHNIIYKE